MGDAGISWAFFFSAAYGCLRHRPIKPLGRCATWPIGFPAPAQATRPGTRRFFLCAGLMQRSLMGRIQPFGPCILNRWLQPFRLIVCSGRWGSLAENFAVHGQWPEYCAMSTLKQLLVLVVCCLAAVRWVLLGSLADHLERRCLLAHLLHAAYLRCFSCARFLLFQRSFSERSTGQGPSRRSRPRCQASGGALGAL